MRWHLTLLLPACLLLSGCLGDWIEFSCLFMDDEEHCFQAAAVQESEPDDCEKVITERFEYSNPPRDKCYLMIAENTGDPSVCDEIVGGPASYTREGCLNSVLSQHHPNECSDVDDEVACRTVYATHGRGCGEGFTFVSGVCDPITYGEPEIEEDKPQATNTGLSKAERADIDSLYDAATGKYGELLQADIDSETDPARKAGLEAYQSFLGDAGEKLDEVKSTYEDLLEIKSVFLDAYDPANDISNYDVAAELDPGYYDQIKDRLFGSQQLTGIDKENADAENSLTIYEQMLEQQSDNDFMQQGLLGRLSGIITDRVRSDLTDKVTEQVTDIAKDTAGTAFGAVTHVGDALQAFQDEAQHQMFLGLARAYNRRRDDLERRMPNATPEQIHQRTVREVKQNPYADNTNTGFIKHGNILENPDCKDDSNPLCINDRVWWTAMDRTYVYNRQN